MFDFIYRLFGTGTADGPPGTVATIRIVGYEATGAWGRARLVARDTAGTTLLATDVTTGTGPAFAARIAFSLGSDTMPNADYLIETVLPARTDEAGVLYGSNPMLRLRGVTSGRVPPLSQMVLLIYGGSAGRLMDSSIRMDDGDLATLLALLPSDPGQVRVRLVCPIADADDDWFGWISNWGSDDVRP